MSEKPGSTFLRVRSSLPLNLLERRAITRAIEKNRSFFGFKVPSITIVVCHSNKEWKRETKYYFHPIARGLVLRDGTVVVKSRHLGGISLRKWKNILTHEVNHSFWCSLSRRGRDLWSPLWLVEGLACVVGGNYPIRTSRELARRITQLRKGTILPFRYRASLVKTAKDVRLQYSIWRAFVEWLYRRNRKGLIGVVLKAKLIRSELHFERMMKRSLGETSVRLFECFAQEERRVR